MNADIERLISLLNEPDWYFDQIDLHAASFHAPANGRLAIESVHRRAAVVAIQFFTLDRPGPRPRLTIEAPSGVGPTQDSLRWHVEAAKQITWEHEEISGSGARPAVVFGRKRAR